MQVGALQLMPISCPACGGHDIVLLGPGYARCDSSRVNSPRGPQDLYDGRRCGHRFWIGISREEQDALAADARHREDLERSWEEWAATVRARLEATTEATDIARLFQNAAINEARRAPRRPAMSGPQRPLISPHVYSAAWRRLAASGGLLPTHALVTVRHEGGFFREACAELMRRALWRCDPSSDLYFGDQYVDENVLFWHVQPVQYREDGRNAQTGTFAIPAGAPVRLSSGRLLTASGPVVDTWTIADGRFVIPMDAAFQESWAPGYVVGLFRTLVDAAS